MPVEIITDKKDNKQYAKVPLRTWNTMQRKINKQKVLDNLKRAVEEVNLMEKGLLQSITTEELWAQL